MKKLLTIITLFMVLIPSVIKAETCDVDKISISSISVEEKSGNVTELKEASASGRSINLNLSMSDVGDNIKYKIIVKNDSNEDFELDKNGLIINSDYIDYSLESSDNSSNIVKAKSTRVIFLKAEYKKEVPEEAFSNGTYKDNKTISVELSNNKKGSSLNQKASDKISNNKITNPKTGVQTYSILLIVMFSSGIVYILLRKRTHGKYLILLIGFATLIPISVYAICKCEVKVESKVEIKAKKKVCVMEGIVGTIHLLPYMENVTWDEYYERSSDEIKNELLNVWGSLATLRKTTIIASKCFFVDGKDPIDCYLHHMQYKEGPFSDEDFQNEYFWGTLGIDDKVLDSTKACYTYID